MRDLPLFIPREAYVLQEAWLETGHALWANLLPQGRDYFLPRFSADLTDYDKVPVSSRDGSCCPRQVGSGVAHGAGHGPGAA